MSKLLQIIAEILISSLTSLQFAHEVDRANSCWVLQVLWFRAHLAFSFALAALPDPLLGDL